MVPRIHLHSFSSETNFSSYFFFLYFLCKKQKCHKFYPNWQCTVTLFWSELALDTERLTKIYWRYSTRIFRACFIPLLQSTLQRDLNRNCIFQITFNSFAIASLYELLCYISPEQLDPMNDEFLTSIHITVSSLHSLSATFKHFTRNNQ